MGIAHCCTGIAVAQQLLHLVERMPRVDQKTGEGVPQIVYAHVGQSQFTPQFVPEKIDVGERFARSLAGKEPGTAGLLTDGTDDGHGLFGQGNMTRLAGFGERYGEQMLIQTNIFPAGLEDFALAGASEYEQPQDGRLLPRRVFQCPHQTPGFIGSEITLP